MMIKTRIRIRRAPSFIIVTTTGTLWDDLVGNFDDLSGNFDDL